MDKRDVTDETLDEFHYHEALDRAFLVTQVFTDFVQDHPAVQAHAELAALADRIGHDLADLYQTIGHIATEEGLR